MVRALTTNRSSFVKTLLIGSWFGLLFVVITNFNRKVAQIRSQCTYSDRKRCRPIFTLVLITSTVLGEDIVQVNHFHNLNISCHSLKSVNTKDWLIQWLEYRTLCINLLFKIINVYELGHIAHFSKISLVNCFPRLRKLNLTNLSIDNLDKRGFEAFPYTFPCTAPVAPLKVLDHDWAIKILNYIRIFQTIGSKVLKSRI